MPDDNRFAGLSEAVEEEPEPVEESESESDSESSATVSSSETESESEPESTDAGVETTYEDSASDSSSGSDSLPDSESKSDSTSDAEADTDETANDPTAFSFDETTKKTVYVRQETIDALEDARALVDAQLRTQHDVRDLTGREFYDAAFRLAAADTDGLIEEIRTEREE